MQTSPGPPTSRPWRPRQVLILKKNPGAAAILFMSNGWMKSWINRHNGVRQKINPIFTLLRYILQVCPAASLSYNQGQGEGRMRRGSKSPFKQTVWVSGTEKSCYKFIKTDGVLGDKKAKIKIPGVKRKAIFAWSCNCQQINRIHWLMVISGCSVWSACVNVLFLPSCCNVVRGHCNQPLIGS